MHQKRGYRTRYDSLFTVKWRAEALRSSYVLRIKKHQREAHSAQAVGLLRDRAYVRYATLERKKVKWRAEALRSNYSKGSMPNTG